jgi:uncharacterized protein YydD (DUF2326 family)
MSAGAVSNRGKKSRREEAPPAPPADIPPPPAEPIIVGLTARQPTLVRVSSNQPSFRTVEFKPGFNVVLAERTNEATIKDSRNGLGKSTLIEIITFCLGAKGKKGEGLLTQALDGWSFTLDMNLADKPVRVTRYSADHSKIYIEADTMGWPVQPAAGRSGMGRYLKTAEWTGVLGLFTFGIPYEGLGDTYAPTFRSLISYFVRRGKDAYSTPFEHFRKQLEWDKQVNNAFLLGLAWKDARDWQLLRDKLTLLADLQKAARTDLMAEVLQGSVGELEASKIRLEAVIRGEQAALTSFQVHPQYRELEENANRLSTELHEVANKLVAERQILGNYEEALNAVPEPNLEEVVAVYQEAGVFFTEQIRRRLEEVKSFHRQLIENRRRFLATEIGRLKQGIDQGEVNQRNLIDERAELMRTLSGRGALDEYTRLQESHANHQSQLKAFQARIEAMRRLEEGKSNLRIEEERLRQRTRNDLDDRRSQRERAITLFNANSQALYESPGTLIVDIGKVGFQFGVEIQRSESQGIGNMKVYCYDLMLAELWASAPASPRLLIHDSTLFDGVDERQVALALELAAKKAEECKFQYICTLNSDLVPWEDFSEDFDLRSYVRLELTDREVTGSLLGIRY